MYSDSEVARFVADLFVPVPAMRVKENAAVSEEVSLARRQAGSADVRLCRLTLDAELQLAPDQC